MDEITNNFSLAGEKSMPEIHLRQPGFTYNASELFTKNKEIMQKLEEIGDSRYIYQSELDQACFQHDMAYRDFVDCKIPNIMDINCFIGLYIFW